MGGGVGGRPEAPWGPAREILRAPSGHSCTPGTPLHFLTLGHGGPRGEGRDSKPPLGWSAPSGPLETHPLGLFAANGCHFRGVRWIVGTEAARRGELYSAQSPELPHRRSQALYILSWARGGFPQPWRIQRGPCTGNTPPSPPAFLLRPAASWELALWRRGSRLFSQTGEQTDK